MSSSPHEKGDSPEPFSRNHFLKNILQGDAGLSVLYVLDTEVVE